MLFNIAKKKTGKEDLFSIFMIDFLNYFQENFLKIGNIPEKTLQGHKNSVKAVAFAMDDEVICSGCNNG